MFSAETPSHSHATRSKRTRQTSANDDSVKQPLTKKRRSALRRDTFEPLTDANINEVAGREKQEPKTNGHAVLPAKQHARTSSQPQELTLRGGKKPEKRTERGGGQLLLSSNEFYSVAQLPSLPDKIRSSPTIPYSCVISPEHDYILALGHTEAFLWPYNTSASTPAARDLITFTLPFPPASAGDPLPLATFTAKSANGEPGIVAVSPKWGKVVYWESISSASSFIPGQITSGVQGSVPAMLAGESIKELVKAEPAGFIITFSHGRVAHLTVRDQMGRPGIGIQFLRKPATGASNSGFFGSIRNVFVGDRRKGTPIARCGKAAKAQRELVVATEEGDLEFWNINLSVGNAISRTMSIKDDLLSAVQQRLGAEHQQSISVKILDFEVASTPASGHEITKRGDTDSLPLLILASTSAGSETTFALFETVVLSDELHIKEVHELKVGAELLLDQDWQPRICVSKSHAIAFILFGKGIVLISLARIRESPSSQLLMEKAGLPQRFQDCIQFQEDSVYRVLGFAGEEVEKDAACVFAVQGFGVVRVTSHLQNESELDVEDIESTLGPKTKIEQAIFFGTIRQNPLDLSKTSQHDFAPQEIDEAILRISEEVLSSSSKYIPRSSPSLDHQIKLRAKALDELTHHALKHYRAAFSVETRFQLLWNAEKLAAAQAIWKVQEKIQREYPKQDDREFTYLQFVLRALHESRQKYPNPEKGETDHVRYWLIHSVEHIDHLISELDDCLRELDPMDVRDPKITCDYMTEAVKIWTAIYETAFKFREDHAPSYGLDDEIFKDGVLQRGYPAGLPYPWTSAPEPFRFGQRLLYDVCNFLAEWWDHEPAVNGAATKTKKLKVVPTDANGKPYNAPSKEALRQLAYLLPKEVALFNNVAREETIQAVANTKRAMLDPETEAAKIAQINGELRPRMVHAVRKISHFNMPGAINIGEKMEDPGLLVELNTTFLKDLETKAFLNPDDRLSVEKQIHEVQQHIESYYDRFGNGWAFAHFSNQIITGSLGRLLAEAQHNNGQKQKYLNWFLKKSKAMGQRVGKLSWINEVLGERRYDRAQQTLENVAREDETDVWSQKTELCLAKLAGLAANEAATKSPEIRLQMANQQSRKYDQSLELLEVQSTIVQYIAASVSDALDEKAARELALGTFAKRVVDKCPAMKRILTAAIDATLTDQNLSLPSLINFLTLVDPTIFTGPPEEDPEILDHEFAIALNCIHLASASALADKSLSPADLDSLRMLVWRRAMIRDDWLLLNNTAGKSDQEVMDAMQSSALFKALLEVFQRHYRAITDGVDVDSKNASNKDVRLSLFSPEEILGAPTLLPSALADAYLALVGIEPSSSEATKFMNELLKELGKEHDKLKMFVEKAQLQIHWEGMVKEGERSVRQWLGVDGVGSIEEEDADHVMNEHNGGLEDQNEDQHQQASIDTAAVVTET